MHVQEHCLTGIKGTMRRAQDGHVIHANVDTDIMMAEEAPFGSTRSLTRCTPSLSTSAW